jgi:hypothetical protein
MKFRLSRAPVLAVALSGMASVATAASFTTVSFPGNGNIQSDLVAAGPSGNFTTSNGFATPFSIPSTGNNFAVVSAAAPLSITGLSIANATDVFTLMNAFGPIDGVTIGAITFDFVGGTSESVDLVAGVNVRDFFDGNFADSTTAANVENAFTFTNTQGGAGTDDSSTGAIGTYMFDEQEFSLGAFAVGKVLSGIEVTSVSGTGDTGTGDGSPIVLGVTVGTMPSGVPEPTSWALMLVGFGGLGAAMRTRRRAKPATA